MKKLALLCALFVLVPAPADAEKRHRNGGHHHAVKRKASRAKKAVYPPVPIRAAPSAPTPASGLPSRTMEGKFGGGGFGMLLGFIVGAAGWAHGHRRKRFFEAQNASCRRKVAETEAKLASCMATGEHLRARLAQAQAVLRAKESDAALKRQRFEANDIRNTDNQLRYLESADLRPTHVLNREELEVFRACLAFVSGQGLKVCPQISMGEVIKTGRKGRDPAFSAFNSKRLDMLICDRNWYPLVAVEHQGSGHHLGNAEERDKVKRLALGRAGIGLVETFNPFDHASAVDSLEREVARILAARSDR